MTSDQILQWLESRWTIPQERRYSEHGRTDETIVKYANGDIYHQTITYVGYGNFDRIHTETRINGEVVRDAILRYENFGWKEISA